MLHSVILNAVKNPVVVVFALLCAGMAFAAPKSASAYYSDAAFQYIENRLPTAEITCNEGLQYYPNDQKLQMLLDRIKEAKDEQKNENKKNDPNQDQNNDQNQDQNKDQNQDQNKDNQDQNKDPQDQNQQDQNSGESSSSQSDNQSSDSNGGADQQPQPEQPQDQSSDSQGDDQQPDETPAMMSPEDAAQLLKDFDEQNGERKPWKPIRGQARPAKDW
ncbi:MULTISPECIES: hypothetical protein [unclassified Fibrobacter]|uniref:hypothetical protein n=1 Tax=unclassified Fibrobacter TaxID=2634177 RepID=UPI000D6C31A8|nr:MULTISPECIES: hypothetical protein [unclassified Fibrobacter]PWJ68958.1 hypothetical protein BGX12_10613 [Fibrobacter sp. UWR4]PZW63561.1 hypothetical protein C8E88_104413 [Fibrobacter sp. UWR1]